MAQHSIIGRADDNILDGAIITASVVPMATYDLETLGSQRPETRVRFEDTSLTLTWTLAAPAQGDVLAIPVTNLDAGGSPSVLTITNGNGLSQSVPIPDMSANRIPLTVVLDLTLLTPSAATRTDDVWNLVIAGNSVDVTFGGGVFLYGKRALTPDDMQWGFRYHKRHAASDIPNEYLTRYRLDYETQTRSLECVVRCALDQRAELEAWFDANAGPVKPGLLWPFPDVNDAYIGTWGDRFDTTQVGEFTDYYDVVIPFEELSKGKPV